MKDKITQKEYNLYWERGKDNWADYYTKHFPPAHHKMMRKKFLVANAIKLLIDMRGCVAPQDARAKYHVNTDYSNNHRNDISSIGKDLSVGTH